jgi:electron transfer flavoprotein beta subunit
MKILLPIKQVPDIRNVRMDETTGTVIREGVEAIINPLDLYGIELAVRLKEQYGAHITAITMGPAKADIALREAVAMGVDDAVLVSDRAFAGSDTWATSFILSQAIKRLGDFDLIICGERAVDGDTGQVGPGIAAFLDLPVATYVSDLDKIEGGIAYLSRMLEHGYEKLELKLPAVLTVVKEVSNPRLPTLSGKKLSRKMDVPLLSQQELGLDPQMIGLKGSPTKVVKIQKPKVARDCEILKITSEETLNTAVNRACEFLRDVN